MKRPPCPLRSARLGAAAGCALLGLALPAAASPALTLRIDSQLHGARPVGEDERSLLRVEWKAARTRDDETSALGEILARVQRMERTVVEVHQLVEAMPATVTTEPAAAAPIGGLTTAVETQMSWWLLGAGGAAALLLLAFRLLRRRPAPAKAPVVAADLLTPLTTEPQRSPPCPPPPIENEGPPLPPEEPATVQEEIARPPRPMALKSPRPGRPPAGQTPALEEVAPVHDQALELADVMLSMGLAHGAAQTLEEHVRHHPRQALLHWLKLLEIYRRSGMQEQFEESAQGLRQQFNVQAFAWADDGAATPARIEDYSHITERIIELWPTPACGDYLQRLLEDNRGGTRTGFPAPVAEEILLLLRLLGRA